jgi:tetratricopeptide (TPR) repeat protein
MVPGVAADLELMRVSALLEADPAAAVRQVSILLERVPDYEEAKLLLATACRRLGDPAAAIGVLESLAHARADSPTLQLELGRAYGAVGRHAEAIAAFEAAVAADVGMADAWQELAAQHFIAGDTRGGDSAYAEFSRLAPQRPELADAAAALGEQRFDVAAALLRQRLLEAPADVVALRMLASTERARDNFLEAVDLLNRCLLLAPGYAAARYELAAELCAQHRHKEARLHVDRLLDAEPRNGRYMRLRALSLRFYGQNEQALALMQQIVAENPQEAELGLFYGHLLRDVGEQARAIAAYRQALAVQPGLGEAWTSLANLKTVRFTEADLEAMQQQLARSRTNDSNRVNLEFALGKALEDAGKYEKAFEHYAYGNGLHRSTTYFDVDALSAGVQRTKMLYTSQFFSERRGWGSQRLDPIFIIGMPRAGSTLLEQILASHSQVEGTRELPDVPAIARELIVAAGPSAEPTYPGVVAKLGRAEVEAYAERYLRETAVHRPLGKPRFIDKLPGNFAHIALIHLMFPRATIIDARRHPLGCCFSCFRQLFGRGQSFSYNQGELGKYYRGYCELVEHMNTVLPGRLYRVHYEQLVADPENVVRRLLDHCRLSFEPGCLKFYENRRVVNTISSEQVRRPINSDAVDQWRNFEPWLGELKEALGDLVDRYPSFN